MPDGRGASARLSSLEGRPIVAVDDSAQPSSSRKPFEGHEKGGRRIVRDHLQVYGPSYHADEYGDIALERALPSTFRSADGKWPGIIHSRCREGARWRESDGRDRSHLLLLWPTLVSSTSNALTHELSHFIARMYNPDSTQKMAEHKLGSALQSRFVSIVNKQLG